MNYSTEITSYEQLEEIQNVADNCFYEVLFIERDEFVYYYEYKVYVTIYEKSPLKLRMNSYPPHLTYVTKIHLISYDEFILTLLQCKQLST